MSDPHVYSLSGPLDSMPSERQMRTANLSSCAELVRQYGADPRSIREQHGIDPRALRDPDFYIDCKSLVDVFEYCSTTFNDSLFGLRLAQLQEPDVYGCVTALCRAAATMREALERSEEHTSELQSLMRISYAVFCLNKKKKYYHTH